MSKNDHLSDDELSLFREAVQGSKKLQQDTIIHQPSKNFSEQQKQRKSLKEGKNEEFFFSDEFVPLLDEEGPVRYARDGVSKYEVKRLRRGVYVPDVFLDMHGMKQDEAKRELGSMIAYCLKENISCASVMHGIGKHILKKKVPLWLAQHPDVMAFHQAPLEFGGAGAILVLLSIPDR
ncbi:UPF0115 protein [Aliivibrio wodanis]|jgi:DNA-nicking Smr family endonuclease|uniref:Ribosome rescue factor SmrB n=1 Tax=Aliivibrio wodanis TaxID=80852 RepID=A0A090INB1_9GAMM|nr:UPF0115 protein [Aliivibrio wodanis]